ncbi:MAG: archaellar assembly protein FlaJ [Chloroflexi bacterium]|nr:archaellar assembly protein FlaJ [Chloroflexota bacterium]
MIFSKKTSSKRTAEKVSSDNSAISFDLYSNLTYMAALSVGEPSRDLMMAKALEQDFKTGIFFRQVFVMTKRMGFDYSRAFRLVSKKAGAASIKNLLLRFAGAINSGVSEVDFLLEEAKVEAEEYNSTYLRSLETLTKWADAYAALLVSVTLVVVVAMISTMLSQLGEAFLLMLTFAMIFVTGFGVYIIFRTAPSEDIIYQNRRGPKHRRTSKRLLMIFGPIGLFGGLFLSLSYGLPFLLIMIGLGLLPCGVFAYLDNATVGRIDKEASAFIRSLGNVTESLGSTVSVALEKIDRRALGTLDPYIKRLQIRLKRSIDPDKSWNAFRDEAGSALLNSSTRMFVDGVTLGGAPDRVGAIASKHALEVALLRDRRAVSAAPFAILTIPLHFAMTALMVFILEIMVTFNSMISGAIAELQESSSGQGMALLPPLPVFQSQDMTSLGMITTVALVSLTIANALSPKFAMGGSSLLMALFGSITCLMTGFNMLLIPTIARSVLLPDAT